MCLTLSHWFSLSIAGRELIKTAKVNQSAWPSSEASFPWDQDSALVETHCHISDDSTSGYCD